MKKTSMIAITALALPLLISAGRSNSETDATRQAAVSDADQQGPRGPLHKAIAEALKSADLSAEQQKKIDQLIQDTHRKLASLHTLKAAVASHLAAGVRAGALDQEGLAQLMDKAKTAAKTTVRPTVVAALNELHAILNAAQRRAFVEALKAQHEKRMAEHFKGDAEGPGAQDGKGFGHGPRMLRRLADKLGLSQAQRTKIRTKIHAVMGDRRHQMMARFAAKHLQMQEAVDAFLETRFDADKLALFDDMLSGAPRRFKHFPKIIAEVLPELTNEQRSAFADLIEKHAQGRSRK